MQEIFEAVAKENFWTKEKQIQLLLDYISNQQSDDTFVDFILQVAKNEKELR